MQFYSPENFIYLWSIPLTALLFWWFAKNWARKLEKIGQRQLVREKLMPDYRSGTLAVRAVYLILVFLFATLALARPQWGEEKKRIQRKGIDLIFLLDTSLSMLAEDMKPSRLEKSKLEIKNMVHRLKGDRVGMIAFAGSSFLQSPLTLDYSAFQLFLDAIKSGYIPDPGTSLSKSIAMALQSFPKENTKHKALILFSDGEDHEGGLEEALKEAAKANVRVYTLGMGTEKGDPIPLKDQNGRKSGYKKDRNGQIVITKLNVTLMEQIAKDTGGIYLPSTPGEREIDVILKHMASLDKQQFKEHLVSEKEDHYQLFLLFAFLFLCLEMLVRKTKPLKLPDSRGTAVLGLALCYFLMTGFLWKGAKQLNEEGNEHFQNKRYQSAVEAYRNAQIKRPDDPVVRYNLGTTNYQTQDYNQAAKELDAAIQHAETAGDKELLAKAHYNQGNTLYRLGNFEKAIEAYQKTLELDPSDKDAKYNLEFLTNKKSLFDKKNEENKKQDQQKQPNQPKPNQNQQQQQQQQNQQQQNQQQKQDQQQQQDQQNQQDQNQQGQEQDQNQQGQQQDEQEKQDQQNQDQQDQEQKQQEGQQDEQKQGSQGEEEKEQPQQADEQNQESQNQQPEPQQEGQMRQPLQGQMTIENALGILDALKDSEKDLQDLRRPPVKGRQAQPDKDW